MNCKRFLAKQSILKCVFKMLFSSYKMTGFCFYFKTSSHKIAIYIVPHLLYWKDLEPFCVKIELFRD